MHRVAVGSPAQLEGFLKALDEDKHLAMDFWAVMGKMSDEGPAYLAGSTLNARMLEVVVETVTGVGVAEILASGEQPRQVVAQLVRLLAGEDIHSPVVVEDEPEVEAAPDVESRKPVARADSSVPAPAAAVASAPSSRGFRYAAGEMERAERSPVELRPAHRAEEEAPAAGAVEEEAGAGQRTAGRESVKGTTIRWPYEPAAPEPFVQQPPVQQPVPQREVPRARAAFTDDASPVMNKPGPSEEEELERLRLVHWVLENFPATQGAAAARAEADYYGEKLSAAEIFARYAEHRARVTETPVVERTLLEKPKAGNKVEERIGAANRTEGTEGATTAFWRLPEGAVDPNGHLSVQPEKVILPGKPKHAREAKDGGLSLRVPLSDFEDDEEDLDRQRKAFTVVLSVIVVVGILVGLLLAQIHVVDGWRNLRGSIQDHIDAMTHHDRSSLDIPNQLVVDPEPAPPAPVPVRRVVRPPQTRSLAPAKSSYVDRPLVRVLPAPNDRIDPVPGARAGAAYETVLSSDGAGSGAAPGPGLVAPVVVPAAVMQANLISSRLPIYPEGARVADGRVVLQATISKSGTIGHLRVLSGDPALRGAATDAVAKWRYRPYIVNYEPVEVSTTVIVDFSRSQ